MATNVEYCTLSALFGLGRSTVGKIVVETSHAITTHLLPQYVRIPQGDKLKEITDGFETFWGFPQAAGAIDGSHIPIVHPDESASDYYNRKGYYSVIMQAMVDFRGLFMDVYIGWPGKVHNARVFVNSSLYQRGMSSTLFPNWKQSICGVEVIACGESIFILHGVGEATRSCMHTTSSLHVGPTGDFGGSRISLTTLAGEALSRNHTHNCWPEDVQLPPKPSPNGSRKCFWEAKRKVAVPSQEA